MFIFRLFSFSFFILPSLTPGLSLVAMRQPWEPGINPITPGLMRYQVGTVRAGPIGTLDKHDNKESLEVRLRWCIESAMTRSIVDAILYIGIASEQRVPRVSSGPNSLYRSRRQSASASASN